MLNKNQAHGILKDFEGKVQEEAGKLLGNKEQQAKGLQKQTMGKAEKVIPPITIGTKSRGFMQRWPNAALGAHRQWPYWGVRDCRRTSSV